MDTLPAQRDAPSHPTDDAPAGRTWARRFFLAKNSSSLVSEVLSDGSLLEEDDDSSISASLCSGVNFELANQKTDYGFTHGDSAHSVYAVSVAAG